MEKKWEDVSNFLSVRAYPAGFSENKKRALRRCASKFKLNDGKLFHGNQRVIQTEEEAKKIFMEFHISPTGGHMGILRTRSAVCSRYYWNRMTLDIANWVRECEKCQKVEKPFEVSQPSPFIKVSNVWQLVGIDLTGPMTTTVDGYRYILTATDYFSKWVEAFPLKTKCADEVGQRLCSMIYRHGCPKRILSDQGIEFVSQLNDRLCSLLGMERSLTAVYHSETNELDAKTNDDLKRALTKLVNEKQDNWDIYLEATLFSLRTTVQTTTKYSPFALMYGREFVFPSEVPVDLSYRNVQISTAGADYVTCSIRTL